MSPNVDELVDGLLADFPPATTPPQEFLGEQFDRGLAWLHFPLGAGGLGLTPRDQQRAQARLSAGGAPVAGVRNPIGYGMCAPDHRHARHARAEGALPPSSVHQ